MLHPPQQQPNTSLFPAADFWHFDPRSGRTPARFKEWSHFSVLGGDFDLLVNFSVVIRGGPRGGAIPRLVLLFGGADGTWDGDVETFGCDETAIVAGSPDAAMGRNSIRFANSRYHLDAALSNRDVRVALDFVPHTRPLVADNVRLSELGFLPLDGRAASSRSRGGSRLGATL